MTTIDVIREGERTQMASQNDIETFLRWLNTQPDYALMVNDYRPGAIRRSGVQTVTDPQSGWQEPAAWQIASLVRRYERALARELEAAG